ncbi:MAG: methyl-accepting chemotaxis protein, partial [Syntrophales bacterium]|nr:methyl-accepting chemotaxis protein [Syntrophales bacterium]
AAEAAKNTSSLIENTIKAVRIGNDLTISTQEAFKENIEIANKIGQLINEIATATQEQAHGIAQINTAVSEMDKVTQQNAANAEESASAAEELSAQAEQMRGYVDDLANVVGGAAVKGDNGDRSAKGSRPVPPRAALAAPTKGRKTIAPPSRKKNPAEVIPLEENFKDF